MVRAALSLGSDEGTKVLRRFVYDARRDGTRGIESLVSDFNLIAPHPGLEVWHTRGALVPRDGILAYFSALYWHLHVLDTKATLFSISKRAKLATMARYRKSIVTERAGGIRARDANLRLFRAAYPHHAMIKRPEDRATKSAAHDDWIRLRDRLREGRLWPQVRDLFGGDGAFLSLPPQCVPDKHVVRMPATIKHLFEPGKAYVVVCPA